MSASRRAALLANLMIAVAFLAAPAAQARIVPPGGNIDSLTDPLTGVTLADRPDLIGDIIADLTVPFDNGLALQGTIRTQVVREEVAGTLDFYYTIFRGTDVYSISGFQSFSTDVDFRLDLGFAATGVHRSDDGDTLDFVNVSSEGPTFVKTNATEFALTGKFELFDENGDPVPATATVYVPTATAIPLPPALLAAPPAFALAVLASRRFKARRAR